MTGFHTSSSHLARFSKRKRLIRLLKLAIIAILTAYLTVNCGMAWLYTRALTHPGCLPPSPLPDFPAAEEHFLQIEDGVRLPAWYYPSRNRAAIVTLGGLQGALGDNLPPAGFLVRAGYGVLQIGSRTCADPPSAVTLGEAEVKDAATGLRFLQNRPEVGASRVGVFGFSMGGVTAIRMAARNPEIAAVIAEGGFSNLGADIVEGDWPVLQRGLLYSIAGVYWLQTGANPWKVSPLDDLPLISPRPVLLIYGEGEQGSGRAQAQFAAAHEPKALWIVPGGDHGSNYAVAGKTYEQKVLEFFERYLLGPSPE